MAEASGKRVTIGDRASVQAVTRVITEQASFEYFHQEPS